MESSLAGFLTSLAAGGGTFLAGKWLLLQLPGLSRRQRFFTIYLLSFGLAGGAYGLQVYLGQVAYSPEGLFAACVTAFAASQALWGVFEAKEARLAPLRPVETIRLGDMRSVGSLFPKDIAAQLAAAGYRTAQDIKDTSPEVLIERLGEAGMGAAAVRKIIETVNM